MNEHLDEDVVGDELVRAALEGDESAFHQVYEEMYGTLGAIVFNMLDKRTMAKEGASDLIQDAFVKVWERKHQLQRRTLVGFQGWLIEIVRNLARDKYEYWRRGIRSIDRERPVAQGSDSEQLIPAQDASTGRQRRIDAVWEALNDLPVAQREAVRLQKLENWTQAQIAKRLNCSESAVQGLLRRGKKTLAGILKGDDSQKESEGR